MFCLPACGGSSWLVHIISIFSFANLFGYNNYIKKQIQKKIHKMFRDIIAKVFCVIFWQKGHDIFLNCLRRYSPEPWLYNTHRNQYKVEKAIVKL